MPLIVAVFAAAAALATSGCGRSEKRTVSRSSSSRTTAPARPTIDWPIYGLTPDHHRYLPVSIPPPYRIRWTFNSSGLLEFPPAISNGVLYQLNDNAVLNAVDTRSGRPRWYRQLGALSASTPAVGGGAVYATVLDRGSGAGRVTALSAADGHTLWTRDLPSASESSPLLHGGTLYFGTQGGTVYALRARDGGVKWTFSTSGAVKGSPTLAGGALYFGDYGHEVHAVSASTGQPIWTAQGSDSFYATAAVAYGRVYIGDTSGEVYAFDARTGNQLWSQGTGSDVYASAAVLDAPRLGPTIYLGSYDGNFYALDARSGAVRWIYPAGGRISGSATIIGRIVYFADLADHTTTGLDVVSGRPVYRYRHGTFDPITSDGQRLYLDGLDSVVALDPARPPSPIGTPPAGGPAAG